MSYCDWIISIGDNHHKFGEVEVTSWNIGGREYRTDDTDRPRADGRWFGQDFATPGDVEIELIIRAKGATRQERFENAMAIRQDFQRVWDMDSIRFVNGAVAELEIAGVAVVEGRPRHVDWDDTRATFGIIRGTALFVRSSDEAYEPGAMSHSITVGLVPPSVGGIIAPLVAPISTTRASSRSQSFEVGGESNVWPIITVSGPIQSGASVELINGWRLVLNRALAYDQKATFDTRPTHRSMNLNGKTMNLLNPAGARLSQMSIAPGVQSIALRGNSVEGTASVRVEWRETKKVI